MASNIMDSVRSVLVPIHPEGWRFIGIFALITLFTGFFWPPFLFIGGVLTAWCAYFFRNPDRVTPVREGLAAQVDWFRNRPGS